MFPVLDIQQKELYFWDSINYVLSSTDAILTDCYADTGMTGFLVTKDARLIGCSYFNNYTYKMDDVTVIDHRDGVLSMSDCVFRKDSPHATAYKGNSAKVISKSVVLIGFDGKEDICGAIYA